MALQFHNPNQRREGEYDDSRPVAQSRPMKAARERAAAPNSLGHELRNVRQSKGLELSQISSKLKISKRYLAAIEESDFAVLPHGKAYHVGFARSYAIYLGLNATQCVEKLQVEIAEREAKQGVAISKMQMQEPKSASPVKRTLKFLGLGGYEP